PAGQPRPRELEKSTSRGLYSEIPVAGVGVPVPASKPAVVKPPVSTKPAASSSKPAAGKTTTAALKTTKPVAGATATSGKKNSKNKSVTAAGQSSQTDGQTASLGADSNLVPVSHTSGSDLLVVSARLNKSGSSPHYKVGEKLEITVGTGADCSLVVFDYDSNGTLT